MRTVFQGFCFQPESSDGEFVCKCSSGYGGERCERLDAISYRHIDSYIALEPLEMKPAVNLTLTVTSESKTGVLVYYGEESHLAVELYEGRVKVSYYVGNYPGSVMYSYVPGKCWLLFST